MLNRFEGHFHTEYSNIRLLDAINRIKPSVDYAIKIGLKGLAITDHGCISGWIKANKLQQELDEKGIDFKIALGEEGYLVDKRENNIKYYHCIWIAKDKIGAKQIRKISTTGWLNSYFDRGMERVPVTKNELEKIVSADPGHIIVTTACIGGEVSSNILAMENARKIGDNATAELHKQKIVDFILWAKELFGEDFYLEVAPAPNKEQIIVNKKMVELSKIFGVKMVLGCDAHYLTKEDRFVHEAFLNSKGGERETAAFYSYSYLQTEEEIIENLTPSIVDMYEELCQNSMEIYDKIEKFSLLHSQQIPKVAVEWIAPIEDKNIEKYPILYSLRKSKDDVERYWVNECFKKLGELNKFNDTYLSRLEEEADIKRTIGEALDTNMFAYPCTLQHYVDLFWECGSTVGTGRGSACSGLNHYLLGITHLDPIEWNLPFWRYLNKERFELGDIDLDLAPSKRPLIINRIKEERGKNFNEDIDELSRKNLGATLVATFGTESTKSAILTACRGYRSEEYPDGIDNDTAQYLSSLVPSERGFIWSMHDMVFGDPDKDRKPVAAFIQEVGFYPGLLEIINGIEGIISRRGSHASGVIFQDEDPYNFGCFMRTPSGDVITQFDLHDAEAAGMTKYDFLVTSVQDKITTAIELLQKDGEIENYLTLREVYNKYFHPSVLNIEDKDVWNNIQNVKVLDLFQFDSTVGSQAAKKIRPSSMYELADANGLMRLMTAEKGAETPMDKYVRFKNNIKLWYEEMDREGLTKEEQETLKPHFLRSHGVPPSQEQMMTMLMDPDICSFSLKDANAARKIVGKKQMSKIPALKEQVMKQAKRPELGQYVWTYGIGPQLGYSFSVIHALAYSYIGYQTAYIATHWNPIYWNTACLIVNSGSLEDTETSVVSIYEKEDDDAAYKDLPDRSGKVKEKNASYDKIAKAIGAITSNGIRVSLININESDYGFKPDVKHNRILYGLKALSGINSEMIETIIKNRPYSGIKDFMSRCPLTKTAMITLIKSGAFDEIDEDFGHDRRKIMAYYIMTASEPKKRITLQNFNGLIEHNIVPKELEMQIRIFNFNKYLKQKKLGTDFILDEVSINFLNKFLTDVLDDVRTLNGGQMVIDQKIWDKTYQLYMDAAREWIKNNQTDILNSLNKELFLEVWNKYAIGNLSKWEMDSLCFYYNKHELSQIDNNRYGISNYNELPEIPEVEYYFKRNGHEIPIYKLTRIAGTVIAKNDTKHLVTILTTTGVVDIKFTSEYYAMFKKQISQIQPDGTKKVLEKSWFRRGVMIMITGFRRDNQFVAKTYASTIGHQLYRIELSEDEKEMKLFHDRNTGSGIVEEEYYE